MDSSFERIFDSLTPSNENQDFITWDGGEMYIQSDLPQWTLNQSNDNSQVLDQQWAEIGFIQNQYETESNWFTANNSCCAQEEIESAPNDNHTNQQIACEHKWEISFSAGLNNGAWLHFNLAHCITKWEISDDWHLLENTLKHPGQAILSGWHTLIDPLFSNGCIFNEFWLKDGCFLGEFWHDWGCSTDCLTDKPSKNCHHDPLGVGWCWYMDN
ncbi:MAG: hypothetical protein JST10_12800 [Bacteroidetes bacterium]|nr:hypothetical protein [Bacteroidota bacterium]